MGIIFQAYNLLPSLTARENIALPMLIDGTSGTVAEKKTDELVRLVHLEHRASHRPQAMSGGEQQRIAIARALVDKPRVLLFDEANSFIDGAGDKMLRDLLIKLSGRVTLVMVTPRPSMLEIADRIFDISGASVVERQPPPGPDQAPAEQPEAT